MLIRNNRLKCISLLIRNQKKENKTSIFNSKDLLSRPLVSQDEIVAVFTVSDMFQCDKMCM